MPDPHLRAADIDREAVATALGTHMAAGRLTLAEYDERVGQAWGARTYGDLAALTADLPSLADAAPTAAAAGPALRPAAAACAPGRGVRAPLHPVPMRTGQPEHGWHAWASTALIVLVVYLAVSLGRQDLGYFWPMWVIGPWGAVLLARTATGGRRRGQHGLCA
ncbi:MAG: DUF1707 domain-containing protein [Actinomycetes bacterium]